MIIVWLIAFRCCMKTFCRPLRSCVRRRGSTWNGKLQMQSWATSSVSVQHTDTGKLSGMPSTPLLATANLHAPHVSDCYSKILAYWVLRIGPTVLRISPFALHLSDSCLQIMRTEYAVLHITHGDSLACDTRVCLDASMACACSVTTRPLT